VCALIRRVDDKSQGANNMKKVFVAITAGTVTLMIGAAALAALPAVAIAIGTGVTVLAIA